MRRSLLGIAVAAVLLTGCGGAEEPPTIPSTLAEELSQRADEIAVTLESGDECAAQRQARELRAQVRAAGEEGRIEPELRDPLVASIDGLVGRIRCVEERATLDPAPEPGAPGEPARGFPDCEVLEDRRDRLKDRAKAAEERLKDRAKAAEERLKERADAAEERAGDDKEARDAARDRFKEDREALRERFDAQEEALKARIDACKEAED